MKPATEILLSAAFVLTPEENWWDGKFGDGGRWCAYIAIGDAAYSSYPNGDDLYYMNDACRFFKRATGTSTIQFNDTHTHAEVLDALYRAAELSEGS